MRGLRLALLAACLFGCGQSDAAPPVQPVAFSHRIHAGVNQIGCGSCHAYTEHGPAAGIPSMARCMGCHRFVAKDNPEVKLVLAAADAGTPIEWKRVHRLPDHVYFTHERHVLAGVRCAECHGDVASMDVVKQQQPLTMGFCLSCHNRRSAPTDCLTCHK